MLSLISHTPFLVQAEDQAHTSYKTYAEITPYYSSTDPIIYQTVSANGEKLLLCMKGRQSGQPITYIAQANGTRLTEIFSAGYYKTSGHDIYFAPLNIPPAISGNGEIVLLGVRAVLDINRRNDFVMSYNSKTQRRVFFQLRLLIPGTNYVKLPETGFEHNIFSMNFEGTQMVCQIETGLQTSECHSYDTALLISSIEGSNQRILVGPEDFSNINCSFRWKDYPKSPHQPQMTHDGSRVVFYGQVFGTRNPYDKNGELFVINFNKSNLRQLTFLRREERKLESLGPFVLNYYGSRIYFKYQFQHQFYISSIALEGGRIQTHTAIDPETPFAISGDGRRLFYVDKKRNHSLVYYDISREIDVLVIDKTWSGTPYRYGLLNNMTIEALMSSSMITFNGNQLFLLFYTELNSWIFNVRIDSSLQTLQKNRMVFEINRPIVIINDRRVSLSVPAYLKDSRAMIPIEIFTEYFGYRLISNTIKTQFNLMLNGNLLTLTPGKSIGIWNGASIPIYPPMEIKQGVWFIPASILRDYLGLSLHWDNAQQSLEIARVSTP